MDLLDSLISLNRRAKVLAKIKPSLVINGPEFEYKLRDLTEQQVAPYDENMRLFFEENRRILEENIKNLRSDTPITPEMDKDFRLNATNFVDGFMSLNWMYAYRQGVYDMQGAVREKNLRLRNVNLNKAIQKYSAERRQMSITNLTSSVKKSINLAAVHFNTIEPLDSDKTFLKQVSDFAQLSEDKTQSLLKTRETAIIAGTAITLAATTAILKEKVDARIRHYALNETSIFWNKGLLNVAKSIDTKGRTLIKTWHTAEDERVCIICEGLNGDSGIMSSSFGDGFEGPPAHLGGCRCFLTFGFI